MEDYEGMSWRDRYEPYGGEVGLEVYDDEMYGVPEDWDALFDDGDRDTINDHHLDWPWNR